MADSSPAGAEQILARYPKQRPPLPPAYQALHQEQYRNNRQGRTLASRMALWVEGWMHRQVAADCRQRSRPYRTLEVGAGTLNHLPFETSSRPYDVVEPIEWLYRDVPARSQVGRIYPDIALVPGPYERIISIATFEHLEDLPLMIARCAALLTPDGNLRIAIPSEGSWLWRLAYTLSTGLEFRLRYGLDYEVFLAYEHLNDWTEVNSLLRYAFHEVQAACLGLSPGISVYQFYSCRRPTGALLQ